MGSVDHNNNLLNISWYRKNPHDAGLLVIRPENVEFLPKIPSLFITIIRKRGQKEHEYCRRLQELAIDAETFTPEIDDGLTKNTVIIKFPVLPKPEYQISFFGIIDGKFFRETFTIPN